MIVVSSFDYYCECGQVPTLPTVYMPCNVTSFTSGVCFPKHIRRIEVLTCIICVKRYICEE